MFTPEEYQKILKHFKERDSIIYQLLQKHNYLKPLPLRNLFSHLIGGIIGQRIRFSKAQKLRGQLYTLLGTDNFTPQDILDQDDPLKFLIQKVHLDLKPSEIILRVSQHCLKHALQTPNDVKKLLKLKGIGNWTVHCALLMYSLQEDHQDFLDYLLTEDLIIRRGLQKLYPYLTPAQIQEHSHQCWSPYQGIITWYLWKEFT